MGGYDSGERWYSKSTTGQALRLDVRWLVRAGVIRPGIAASMPLQWTSNGKPSGDIMVRFDARRPDELTLEYRTRGPADATWTDVREAIPLERTPCNFGGERVWCRCPGCGQRKAVLYSLRGGFRCVRCNQLAYSSTREIPLYRLGRRGDALLKRLGAEPEWVLNWVVPPDKPQGMHWRTYAQLRREWEQIRDEARGAYTEGLMKLLNRPIPSVSP